MTTFQHCTTCKKSLQYCICEFGNLKITEGLKYDNGKPDLTIVDKNIIEAAARALTFGAKKYTRGNYKHFKKEDLVRLYASLLRHAFAITSGEQFDRESGLKHLDHIAANVNIICYLENKHGSINFDGEEV